MSLQSCKKYEKGRICSMHEEKKNVYKISVRKPEGKILFGRHGHR
jgi:hypothetical protein